MAKYVNLPTPHGTQRWKVAYRKMADYGLVDWGTRTIWLREGQTNAELVGTILHEAVHVATGLGSEETIEAALDRIETAAVAILLKEKLIVCEED